MKKIILASVALIALFASCKKEDIRTVYKTKPAEVTITVEVYDALYGKNVTSQANIASSVGTVSGNTVKIVGDEAHYNAVPAQKVTISASYAERSGSAGINIDGTLEGGVASYSVTVVVGHAIDPSKPVDYDIRQNGEAKEIPGDKGYLEFATHTHDGSKWVINNTEFVLFGVTEYEERLGLNSIAVDYMSSDGADWDYVNGQAEDLEDANPKMFTKKEYEYTVSAFSYFNVELSYSTVAQSFDCYRINILEDGSKLETLIGNIALSKWATRINYVEIASPDHASHYVAGHGVDDSHYSHYSHGHGHGGSNAGGGIVIAD